MDRSHVERRRGRRVPLQAPMVIRRVSDKPSTPVEEVTKDISLAGVYFETEQDTYTVNDSMMTSVAVPPSQTGAFPFKRLAGRSRVVRVQPLDVAIPSTRKCYGVALEFADDLTALTALPPRV